MRAARGLWTTAAVTVAAVALVGCTAQPDPEPSPGATAAPAPSASAEASAPAAGTVADGVDPAELSRQVLDAAAGAATELPVVSSQTLQVPTGLTADGTAEVTVDVRAVQRREESTVVTLAMSATEPDVQLAPDALSGSRNLAVLDQVAMEDPAAGERYLPLSWRRWIGSPDNLELDGATNSCVCPTRRLMRLGPEPLLMDVVYGPLPADVTTVSITTPDGLLALTDVPVG